MFIFVVLTPRVANDRLKPAVLDSIVVELASSDVHSVNSPSVENGTLVSNYLNQLPCKRWGGVYLTSSWNNDINNDNDDNNNNNNNSNIDKNFNNSNNNRNSNVIKDVISVSV